MLTQALKETPLSEIHKRSGARMVDFAGWNMPVRYESTIKEHMAVRKAVGLFDVSHMGEFTVKGSGGQSFLQYMIANDLFKLKNVNTALYTQLLNQQGGTVDDLIIYRRADDYLLVVNASNIEKDWQWLQSFAAQFPDMQLENESDKTALLALQGPHAQALMEEAAGKNAATLSSFHYTDGTICGIEISYARTGYTGEDGYEIFVKSENAADLWEKLILAGKKYGIEPCGLGARDTLRLEACLPLYGHELDDQTGPLEAGLDFSVSLNKDDFLGKAKLLEQKASGLSKKLVCLTSEAKALPRQGYAVKASVEGPTIGSVTSGSQGIAVNQPIAMAYVPPDLAKVGTQLYIDIRGQAVPSKVVARPFYKAKKANK